MISARKPGFGKLGKYYITKRVLREGKGYPWAVYGPSNHHPINRFKTFDEAREFVTLELLGWQIIGSMENGALR